MKNARGFTLTELLVAVCIMSILIALGMGGVKSALGMAQRAGSASNLSQIGKAMHLYVADNQGKIPGENQSSQFIIDSTLGGLTASNTILHKDLMPYLNNNIMIWKAPGDRVFFHNYWNGTSTSYGAALGNFETVNGGIRFRIPDVTLVRFMGDTPASKRSTFADITWEYTTNYYKDAYIGDGYSVCFMDGHVAYYKRTSVQGRYRTDW